MSKRLPMVAKRFLNILWVHFPIEVRIKDIYKKSEDSMYITVFMDPEDDTQKIRRCYSMEAIRLRNKKKDLWGLAQDCAQEIKVAANENNKTQ